MRETHWLARLKELKQFDDGSVFLAHVNVFKSLVLSLLVFPSLFLSFLFPSFFFLSFFSLPPPPLFFLSFLRSFFSFSFSSSFLFFSSYKNDSLIGRCCKGADVTVVNYGIKRLGGNNGNKFVFFPLASTPSAYIPTERKEAYSVIDLYLVNQLLKTKRPKTGWEEDGGGYRYI